MEWITVIALILVGVVLIVVEIIFIPGTTVVGIIGFFMTLAGIAMSFKFFGTQAGWITLGVTGVFSGLIMFWALRSKAWERFSLKTAMDGKVNEGALTGLREGEEGVAVSSLRPRGKADIGGKLYEVTTRGNFLDSGTRIKIIQVSSNQILVEPLN